MKSISESIKEFKSNPIVEAGGNLANEGELGKSATALNKALKSISSDNSELEAILATFRLMLKEIGRDSIKGAEAKAKEIKAKVSALKLKNEALDEAKGLIKVDLDGDYNLEVSGSKGNYTVILLDGVQVKSVKGFGKEK